MTGPLRYGMVGGGPGAFIGEVHRMAARLDGEWRLVAGAFSSDPERSREKGRELGLAPERVYGSWREMIEEEGALPEEERIRAVTVVTPNDLHHAVARGFLDAGFHVICDKPMTTGPEDAEDLCRAVDEAGALFVLTHNYAGYPMVKEAREIVRSGRLGPLRKVVAEYSQGWLSTLLEAQGQRQAEWRTDPTRAGVSSALADIGSHAEHLVRYVTGLEIDALCADLSTQVEGRALEDDANVLIRYRGGARGVLVASQISAGDENDLTLRVYGEEGGIAWRQERPGELELRPREGPLRRLTRGSPGLSEAARHATRLPPGHPEGFIEAFANLYRSAARTLRARLQGREPDPLELDLPDVRDGARGVHFIHRAVESSRRDAWVDASYTPPAPPGS